MIFILDLDECTMLAEPCPYGGKCTNILQSYYCICPLGRTGRFCEKGKDLIDNKNIYAKV